MCVCDCCLGGEHPGEGEGGSSVVQHRGRNWAGAQAQLEPPPDSTTRLGALDHESHHKVVPSLRQEHRSFVLLCQLVTGLGWEWVPIGSLNKITIVWPRAVLWRVHS